MIGDIISIGGDGFFSGTPYIQTTSNGTLERLPGLNWKQQLRLVFGVKFQGWKYNKVRDYCRGSK
jgi:hypothetical protein